MTVRARGDAGMVSVAVVATVGLTLVLLVAVAYLLVASYVVGVAQSAAEEGARQGAATGSVVACEARAAQAVADGVGGRLRDGVAPIVCAVAPGEVRASTELALAPWLPGLPEVRRRVQAVVAVPEDR